MSKPLWSVMIPTYNSEKFLAETLESVLKNNYSSNTMEIVVVDNCSTDNTKAIVETVGRGRVKYIQNLTNIGMVNNFNECIKNANGSLIHILNSDDCVKKNFYVKYEEAFKNNPDVYFISSLATVIDDAGTNLGTSPPIKTLSVPSNNVEEFLYDNPFRTPAIVVRKEAYEKLGGFNTDLIFAIDWEMWVRVIAHFKGLHLNEELAYYRNSLVNQTSKIVRLGQAFLDYERVYKIFEKFKYPIDKNKALEILRKQTATYYYYFLTTNDKEAIRKNRYSYFKFLPIRKKMSFVIKVILKTVLFKKF